jgi:hypothetical protein
LFIIPPLTICGGMRKSRLDISGFDLWEAQGIIPWA